MKYSSTFRMLQHSMQRLASKNISFALIFVFVCSFLGSANTSYADNEKCEIKTNVGSAFFNFKKMIVYYRQLPYGHFQKKTDFPDEWKSTNFKKVVEDVMRENFSRCLNSDGRVKEIITTEMWRAEMLDPENVVIDIRFEYPLIPMNEATKGVSLLKVFVFRAGLSPEDAFANTAYYMRTAIFRTTPHSSEEFKRSLKQLITPYVPPSEPRSHN